MSYRVEGDQTVVPLDMLPQEAFFVVFREQTDQPSRTVAAPDWKPVARLAGPWRLEFQSARGAPATADAPALQSLTAFIDPGIRYFSGVTTYTTTFQAPGGTIRARRSA